MTHTPNKLPLKEMANAIRFLSMDAVQQANSGHPGMPMGIADVATVLFSKFLKFDAVDPKWPDRDRFILSAGHGSMLLYSLMYLTGYKDMDINQLKNFRQLGSRTAGHPEFGHVSGAETTTGPLGQGLGNAVGMALAEEMLKARFGNEIIDHYTYAIVGDGCLMEGISHEAISLAGHLRLEKLIVLFDDNKISIDGSTDLTVSDNQQKRFEACGWDSISVDGHDVQAIESAIRAARTSSKPSFISCRTKIGFGAPNLAGTAKTHGSPLGESEIKSARDTLNWASPPFVVPEDILNVWRDAGVRGQTEHASWDARYGALPDIVKLKFDRTISGNLPEGWEAAVQRVKKKAAKVVPNIATRKASEAVLKELVSEIPELIGGSADLTGSNNTRVESMRAINSKDFSGNYLHWGVREHGMASAMNGMVLHGGFVPYSGTFLVFTDYCRPAIRLSALMKLQVIYVMTHDSIGLGEDGPTHQPVEQLASLRAMPNVLVMRPADIVETAECWAVALKNKTAPSIIALSRQSLPTVRLGYNEENLSAKGAYILAGPSGVRSATIIATGSEVHIALEAQKKLEEEGISTAVVSMPCWEVFDDQDKAYKASVLGEGSIRVAVEAGVAQGWDRYTGENGIVIGMDQFGASGPATELYNHFGITCEAIVQAVKKRV